MTQNQEYVIALRRLVLPEHVTDERITLALASHNYQQFIERDRKVKQGCVNFWMEKIFVPTRPNSLSFTVYAILPSNQRKLLKTIPIQNEQLGSIDQRGGLYHTHCGGYQLVWEASIFQEGAETSGEDTDRDYSQLLSIRLGSSSTNSEESETNLKNSHTTCPGDSDSESPSKSSSRSHTRKIGRMYQSMVKKISGLFSSISTGEL